jgi:hypothetical protein
MAGCAYRQGELAAFNILNGDKFTLPIGQTSRDFFVERIVVPSFLRTRF